MSKHSLIKLLAVVAFLVLSMGVGEALGQKDDFAVTGDVKYGSLFICNKKEDAIKVLDTEVAKGYDAAYAFFNEPDNSCRVTVLRFTVGIVIKSAELPSGRGVGKVVAIHNPSNKTQTVYWYTLLKIRPPGKPA